MSHTLLSKKFFEYVNEEIYVDVVVNKTNIFYHYTIEEANDLLLSILTPLGKTFLIDPPNMSFLNLLAKLLPHKTSMIEKFIICYYYKVFTKPFLKNNAKYTFLLKNYKNTGVKIDSLDEDLKNLFIYLRKDKNKNKGESVLIKEEKIRELKLKCKDRKERINTILHEFEDKIRKINEKNKKIMATTRALSTEKTRKISILSKKVECIQSDLDSQNKEFEVNFQKQSEEIRKEFENKIEEVEKDKQIQINNLASQNEEIIQKNKILEEEVKKGKEHTFKELEKLSSENESLLKKIHQAEKREIELVKLKKYYEEVAIKMEEKIVSMNNEHIEEMSELTFKAEIAKDEEIMALATKFDQEVKFLKKKIDEIISITQDKTKEYIELLSEIDQESEGFLRGNILIMKMRKKIERRRNIYETIKNDPNKKPNDGRFFRICVNLGVVQYLEKYLLMKIDPNVFTTIDPYKCQKETKKCILWILKRLCKDTGSKVSVHYRHFLTDSKREKNNNLLAKFYHTYVNPFEENELGFDDFVLMSSKERREKFRKEFQELDREIGTKTLMFMGDISKLEILSKKLREKILYEREVKIPKDNA